MCHFQVSSHSLLVFHFVIGCWQDYRPPIVFVLQAPNLPWAPVPPRPRCCWVHSVTWVPVTASIAPTLPCATFRSPHTPAGFHFAIGCCMASHCCCLHRHTVAPNTGFGPVTGQMS
ncbi:unnamed protein product, partial [Staurois parvus]